MLLQPIESVGKTGARMISEATRAMRRIRRLGDSKWGEEMRRRQTYMSTPEARSERARKAALARHYGSKFKRMKRQSQRDKERLAFKVLREMGVL